MLVYYNIWKKYLKDIKLYICVDIFDLLNLILFILYIFLKYSLVVIFYILCFIIEFNIISIY